MKDLLLALDCSLRWTNVAVLCGGANVLASERLDIGRRQAAELPLVTNRALEQSGYGLKDVGVIAVTNGPGYFTGIRVGASFAAALAYGLGIRVIPVSTLRMLAWSHILRGQPVLAAVYAGRGFVYAASFGCENDLPTGEYEENSIAEWIGGHADITVVSDDPGRTCEAVHLTCPVIQVLPDAAIVAQIADGMRGTAVLPADLRPAYHRAPQGYVAPVSGGN